MGINSRRSFANTVHVFFLAAILTLLASSVSYAQMSDCWLYDDNLSECDAHNADCYWSPTETDPWCPDDIAGCCLMKGCWMNDGTNSSVCEADSTCSWEPNDANQNPWCWNNVGCCDKRGCWNYINTNESACEDSFDGLCQWDNGSTTWCPEPVGCCHPKTCWDFNESQCNMSEIFDMPCSWDGDNCVDGGFNSFGDADTCISSGGWWNETGQTCQMPTGGMMGGAEVHCWFADNQENVCGNITGCVYCDGTNTLDNTSMCYEKQEGWCQGHEPWSGTPSDGSTDTMECDDIKLKQTCSCGPLGNCKWNSTSEMNGTYCVNGVKTASEMQACFPPGDAKFCDDTASKTNQTMCELLSSAYFMPCVWNTTTSTCKFKTEFMFKDSGPGYFGDISSENSCIAAGGTWKSVNYIESGVVKVDNWCEMGSGKGFDQCDDSCWACEFQPDGTGWADASAAQTACEASALGYCQWTTDQYAFNGLGWCDFPQDFSYGAQGCDFNCKDCEMMLSPEAACNASTIGCKWIEFMPGVNACVGDAKNDCSNDCFSCYDTSACTASTSNCTWDMTFQYCKKIGFTGEICFNGMDDNNDGDVDCEDQMCMYDQFCGGTFMGSDMVTCKLQTNSTSCNTTSTPAGNCSWVEPSWGPAYCDMPGANCWMFDSDETTCNATSGCLWTNLDPAFCEIDHTKAEACFNLDEGTCNTTENCDWVDDDYAPGGGFCDFELFAACHERTNETCEQDYKCNWQTDQYSMQGGWCDPACFNLTAVECVNVTYGSLCELEESVCEPTNRMNACPDFSGNKTGCEASGICQWKYDQYANNNVSEGGEPGWCNQMGMQMMFENMDPSPPHQLGDDDVDATPEEIDIRFFGVKDMGGSLGIGIGVTQVQDAAMCNGYMLPWMNGQNPPGTIGSGNNMTKFYWFLDTDGQTTGGCYATEVDNGWTTQIEGYEFMLKYTSQMSGGTVQDLRTLYKCTNGTWSMTNIPLSSEKSMMCGELGGAMVAVDKESLEAFKGAYNKTKPMRIFVSSADLNHNSTNPSDSVAEPGYYTLGTVDFKLECCDCPGQDIDGDGINSEMDPDCKFVKKFGFIPFEDCMNSKDDNGDGLSDCSDPACTNSPMCGGAFGFAANTNDKQAPSIIFSKADAMPDGAFVKFDTNEPANGTLRFYYNSSTCASLNKTLTDVGDPIFTWDDFKPFHMVPVDNFAGNPNRLGYDLAVNTTYYYKLEVCDPSGNCAVSGCLNFTTTASFSNFVFKFNMPSGFKMNIPALGVTNDNMSYGKTTNSSAGKDLNITINCPESDYSITLVGISLLKAKELNISNITCDNADNVLGMASSTWQKMLYDLSVDYVVITWPVAATTLYHCDDDGLNCVDVTDFAECTFGATSTSCRIPVSLGFSTYKVTGAAGGDSGGGDTVGGGTATATLPSRSMTWPVIEPGVFKSMKIGNPEIFVSEVNFMLGAKAENAKLTVTQLTGKPSSITTAPNENTYKYIQIVGYNMTNIQTGHIEFFAEKTWLTNNSINPDSVALYRYTTGWKKLDTKKLSQDHIKTYYEAVTTGFSVFAIAGEKTASQPAPGQNQTVPAQPTQPASLSTSTTTLILYAAGAIILIAATWFLFFRRHKRW